MNKPSCEIIAEMLVDFSDGDLSAVDRKRVESHLSGCAACRCEVERLGRSLELARSVWAQAAAEASRCAVEPPRQPPARRRDRFRPAAVLAASAAVILAGVGTWWLVGGSREVALRERLASAGWGGGVPAEPTVAVPPDDSGVDELLARKTRAARLAAAARLLATEPSLKVYQAEAERYLSQAYPEDSLTHSSENQSAVSPGKEPKS